MKTVRAIHITTNKAKTAGMGRVSRLALAMAGAMAIWHGAAMADNAAPAPSSAEASAPAATQPFAIGKQLVAVGRHPSHEEVGDWGIYYWSDGSFSAYDADAGTFGRHYSATDDKLIGGWPAGKQLTAVTSYWSQEWGGDIYYWSDGSFSTYDVMKGAFVRHYSATDSKLQGNWPAGKQLVTSTEAPRVAGRVYFYYYWSDGSFSSYDFNAGTFVRHYSATDDKLMGGWPAGKQLAATGSYPGSEVDKRIYYWSDGSFSTYDFVEGAFTRHYSATDGKLQKNWPVLETFNPAQHEVIDVLVNADSAGGVIYANGRMQYKVVVRAQIVDKLSNEGVSLSDWRTSLNQEGQVSDLVTLYLGDDEVDTPGANLAIDGVGDYASNTWKASRTDAGYDKSLNVFARDSEQIDGSIVEHSQDDDTAYPASEGWNSYVYWVSTTEQTGPDPMSICARVGSYNSDDDDDDDGYWDSCEEDWDKSAKVKSLPPKRYVTGDYDISTSKININSEDKHNYALTTVALKNERIKSASISSPPSGSRSDCVGRYSEYFPSQYAWNHNTSLHMIPFGAETYRVNVLGVYSGTDLRSENVKYVTHLQPDRINLVQARARLVQPEWGYWTNCTSYAPYANIDTVGSIQFIDSYGNDGDVSFRRIDWEYLVQ
ncbi:hypothetical protein RA180_15125 [Aeromonas salmonicida]|uniref:hypothetical protein n=1 Tax=Aeromonas salmonicida TaxID=645 RepID=UPI00279689C9|nr:hypothetical protein [Aeromonas salmonicida]MDQ1885321.1 hypothetical protein [Aeromonas salmonicida]